jgi:hypothetical protein
MQSNADTEILRLWEQQSREEQFMPLDEIRTERLSTWTRRLGAGAWPPRCSSSCC